MNDRYDVGDTIDLQADFGTPDPTGDVRLTVTKPDGTTDVYLQSLTQLTHVAASGVYSKAYPITRAGRHTYRFESLTGDPLAAQESAFVAMPPGLGGPSSTYSGDPATSGLDRVRFELSDTGPRTWLFTDPEIAAKLVEHGTTRPLTAAADLAMILAVRFGQEAPRTMIGDVARFGRDPRGGYEKLARTLATRAAKAEGPSEFMPVPAGGFMDSDTLALVPGFRVAEMDNRLR